MGEKIQFRVSPDVNILLRDFADRHGWSPSKAARYLVEMILTRDPEQAAVSEIIWSVQAEARKKSTLLEQSLDARIRAELPTGRHVEAALPAPEELEPEEGVTTVETDDGEVDVYPATSGPLPAHLEPVDERLHGLSGLRRRRRGRRGGRRR